LPRLHQFSEIGIHASEDVNPEYGVRARNSRSYLIQKELPKLTAIGMYPRQYEFRGAVFLKCRSYPGEAFSGLSIVAGDRAQVIAPQSVIINTARPCEAAHRFAKSRNPRGCTTQHARATHGEGMPPLCVRNS
jgi:hypothetical protein